MFKIKWSELLKSKNPKDWAKVIGIILLMGVIAILIIMTIWNFVVSPIFGLPTLNFWQTLLIVFMIRLALK